MTAEVRIFGIVAKLEFKVNVRILRILNDVDQAEGSNFVPLLARLKACFIRLTLKEHDEVGVQLLLQSLVLDLVVVSGNLPEVQLSLKQLLVRLIAQLGVYGTIGAQVVDDLFEQSTVAVQHVASAIFGVLQLELVSTREHLLHEGARH